MRAGADARGKPLIAPITALGLAPSNGVMGLIYAHLVSLGNLRKLVQWRAEAAPQPTAAPS